MAERISRRVFLRVAGGLAGAVALSACAPAPKKGLGPHGSQAVQLVYQDWRTDYFAAMAQQMLEEFHATHPNIHVFYTPDPTDLNEKMMSDFQAQSAPDVFAGCCDFFPVWAQRGYLLDLRPYMDAELDARRPARTGTRPSIARCSCVTASSTACPSIMARWPSTTTRTSSTSTRCHIPSHAGPTRTTRRRCCKFVQPRPANRQHVWGSMFDVSWDRIQAHVNAWGGHFVDPNDPQKSLMARPSALDAMQWLRGRMWGDHAMASRLDVQNLSVTEAFYRGQAGDGRGRLVVAEEPSWPTRLSGWASRYSPRVRRAV